MGGVSTDGKSRDFRLFWLAGAADLLGSHASSLVLPLLVLGLGEGPLTAGLIGTLVALGQFGVAPAAGVYADRYPRRALMTGAAVVAGVAMGVVVVGLATHRLSLPVLLGAAFVEGVAAAVYAAAASGSARRVLPAERPERAVAALRARGQGAELVGPSLGGALYQLAAWAPFLFDAVFYLVAAAFIRSIRTDLGPDRATGPTARPPFRTQLTTGVRFVWSQPLLRFVVLWAAGVNVAIGALYFHVVLVARIDGASASSIGLILTISGAAGVVGALCAPWLVARVRAPVLVVTASWSLVVVVVPLALVTSTWQFGLVLGLVSFISPTLSVVFQTRAIMVTPDRLQSRVGTTLSTIGEGAGAFAPMLAGVLVGAVAPTAIAATFGAALALLACYATVNRVHLRPAAEADPAPDRYVDAEGGA